MFIVLLLFIIISFIRPDLIKVASLEAYSLFVNKVFPSCFFLFVVIDLLKGTKFSFWISEKLSHFLRKLFKLKNASSSIIFLMSFLTGYTLTAKLVNDSIRDGENNEEEGNYLLSFAFFISPIFLFIITNSLYSDSFLKLRFFLSYYLGGLLLPLFIRNSNQNILMSKKKKTYSFQRLLPKAIKDNLIIMGVMLGSITFFLVIKGIMLNFLSTSYFPLFLEVLGGINEALSLNLETSKKALLILMLISFGGLSVHLQVLNIVNNLNYRQFFLGRLLACLISASWFFLSGFLIS